MCEHSYVFKTGDTQTQAKANVPKHFDGRGGFSALRCFSYNPMATLFLWGIYGFICDQKTYIVMGKLCGAHSNSQSKMQKGKRSKWFQQGGAPERRRRQTKGMCTSKKSLSSMAPSAILDLLQE